MITPTAYFNITEIKKLIERNDDYRRNLVNPYKSGFTNKGSIESIIKVINQCEEIFTFQEDKFTTPNALSFIKGTAFGDLKKYTKEGPIFTPRLLFGYEHSMARALVMASIFKESNEQATVKKIEEEVFENLSKDVTFFYHAGILLTHFKELSGLTPKKKWEYMTNVYNQQHIDSILNIFELKQISELTFEFNDVKKYEQYDRRLAKLSEYWLGNHEKSFSKLQKIVAKDFVRLLRRNGSLSESDYGISYKELNNSLPTYTETSELLKSQNEFYEEEVMKSYWKAYNINQIAIEDSLEADMEQHSITELVDPYAND